MYKSSFWLRIPHESNYFVVGIYCYWTGLSDVLTHKNELARELCEFLFPKDHTWHPLRGMYVMSGFFIIIFSLSKKKTFQKNYSNERVFFSPFSSLHRASFLTFNVHVGKIKKKLIKL